MFKLLFNDYDKSVYENNLKDFLPDSITDLHAHLWLSSFRPYGQSNGGATWTKLVADEMTGKDLVDTYKVLFPDKSVTPLVFGGVDQDIAQCNDYVKSQTELYHFPALFRTDYSMSPDYIQQEVDKGGFLGLKPYITNCPPYIPANEIRIFDYLTPEHLEAADKNGWIVMLHIPRSGRLRDSVNVGQLLEIEEKYKNLKLVVAHIGRAYSKQDLGNAFELFKNTKNMLFDFTANLCDEAIKCCIETVGTDRLMFGSDLPITNMRMYRIVDETGYYVNVVPKGLYGDVSSDPRMKESEETDITLMIYEQLLALKRVAADIKLTDSDIEKIMYSNAKKLLRL